MSFRPEHSGYRFIIAVICVIVSAVSADPPSGYYDSAAGLSGSALQQALHEIIDDHDHISYDAIWTAFFTTDVRQDSLVWDMYSDVPGETPPYEYVLGDDQGGSASGEGEGYNREHSWPKSWFGGTVSPMYTDLFQVVPTDIYVNNRRAAYPYGEVSSPSWTSQNGSRLGPCSYPGYSGTVFEPIDAYKGDFARNYFYMATRYLGEDAGWPGSDMVDGAQLRPWAEDMLIEWHLADPVSDKETDRNDAVFAIQDNRNPYIDHPEFVLLVYDPTSVEQGYQEVLVSGLAAGPNPFTASTTIQFVLADASTYSLTVFDISGRRIRELGTGSEPAQGLQYVEWDGRTGSGEAASAGIYFIRLETEYGSTAVSLLKGE